MGSGKGFGKGLGRIWERFGGRKRGFWRPPGMQQRSKGVAIKERKQLIEDERHRANDRAVQT